MRRLCISLAVVTLAGLAVASAAGAESIYSRVLEAYQANGQIPPCQFTSGQLSAALKGVDTYGEQYFADFTDAIQNALAARAGGACLPAGSKPTPTRPAGVTAPPFAAPSITGSTGASLPASIVVLAVLTLLLAAGAGLAVLAARRGWVPRWAAAARHGAGETGYRLAEWWDQRVGRRRGARGG